MKTYVVTEDMVKSYPELGLMKRRYDKHGAEISEDLLRYCAVLTSGGERDLSSRERMAAKAIRGETRVLLKSWKTSVEDGVCGMPYSEMIMWWFRVVCDVKLEVWFSLKVAISEQLKYLRLPIGEDPEKEMDLKSKIASKIENMQQLIARLEDELFGVKELKSEVNEALEKHSFAGYPEWFALDRVEPGSYMDKSRVQSN